MSMVWTPDTAQGLKELVYYPIHFLLFGEIIVFSKYAKKTLRSLAWGWTLMIFFCSFVAIWEITTDSHLAMANEEGGELASIDNVIVQHMTASVTFHNRNAYVTMLCYSFPWIVFLTFLRKKSFLQNIIVYFSIVMSIVVIMFNMSRGGLLAFVIMGILFLLMSPKSLGKTVTFVFLGGILAYIFINYGSQVFLIMQARLTDGGLTHDDARSAIWIVCLQILANYGFIGVGVGGITAALQASSKNIVASPHSLFFEVLVQYGVVFTIILCVFFFRLFRDSWKLKDVSRRVVLLMSLVSMPVYTIINSGYLLSEYLFALVGTIYVFIYIDNIKNSTTRTNYKLQNEGY
jgi:O-antigen ligase